MKTFIFLAALLSFSSAHAADDFMCNLEVRTPTAKIGEINVSQAYGTQAGRLATVPVSAKKNVFGKTVKTVEVTLDGVINNAGTDGSTIDATLALVTTIDRKGPFSSLHSVEKSTIGTIKGKDWVDVKIESPTGYIVTGLCRVYLGE